MTDQQFQARMNILLANEERNPVGWWWLSFAGDDGFRGLVIVAAPGLIHAVQVSRALGINPGGEVQGVLLPDDAGEPPAELRNRLIGQQEAAKLAEEGW